MLQGKLRGSFETTMKIRRGPATLMAVEPSEPTLGSNLPQLKGQCFSYIMANLAELESRLER